VEDSTGLRGVLSKSLNTWLWTSRMSCLLLCCLERVLSGPDRVVSNYRQQGTRLFGAGLTDFAGFDKNRRRSFGDIKRVPVEGERIAEATEASSLEISD